MMPSYQKIELFIESDKKKFTGYGKGKEILKILSAKFLCRVAERKAKRIFSKAVKKLRNREKSHKIFTTSWKIKKGILLISDGIPRCAMGYPHEKNFFSAFLLMERQDVSLGLKIPKIKCYKMLYWWNH